MKTKW